MVGTKEQRLCTMDWPELELQRIQQDNLDPSFTEEEIWHAITQMPQEKAPGPDGFTVCFYRTCRPIIKSEVLAAFQRVHSLNTGPPE